MVIGRPDYFGCNSFVDYEIGRVLEAIDRQPPEVRVIYTTDHDGFGGFQPIRSAFDGRFKFVLNLLASDELYDLEQDPWELQNLISSPEHAAVRNGLQNSVYVARDIN